MLATMAQVSARGAGAERWGTRGADEGADTHARGVARSWTTCSSRRTGTPAARTARASPSASSTATASAASCRAASRAPSRAGRRAGPRRRREGRPARQINQIAKSIRPNLIVLTGVAGGARRGCLFHHRAGAPNSESAPPASPAVWASKVLKAFRASREPRKRSDSSSSISSLRASTLRSRRRSSVFSRSRASDRSSVPSNAARSSPCRRSSALRCSARPLILSPSCASGAVPEAVGGQRALAPSPAEDGLTLWFENQLRTCRSLRPSGPASVSRAARVGVGSRRNAASSARLWPAV